MVVGCWLLLVGWLVGWLLVGAGLSWFDWLVWVGCVGLVGWLDWFGL